MGRGDQPHAANAAAAPRRGSARLVERVEDAIVDVLDTVENKDGVVVKVQAGIYDIEGRVLVEGEVCEVGIPGDEESYDSALGYSASVAEMKLEEDLLASGVDDQRVEQLIESLDRYDMPVY